MSELQSPPDPVASVGATSAAWLATAIGIPVYGASALILSYVGGPVVSALAPDAQGEEHSWVFIGVAFTNVAIALLGIVLVSHTAGRVLFSRTRGLAPMAAGRAFAIMGALLAVVPVVFIAMGQPLHVVGGLYAAIAVGVPCGLTAGLTRAVLPGILESPFARRTAVWVGVLGYVVVLGWTAVVMFGIGR
ncbi:hypothetical protein [Demequina lignilytica]|uniref:DUF998 domain-containing protein n=1 Tax=Demequina lignilytica TaxID=3051663 RepID=A0AAW7M3D3_9MICO|nr:MULTISPECIES: hypothetical protein [unclassified Demequina]MDN4478510.1 hypothetical protein [Demequina sp. SYSU T00039-1]MDN4482332.1 hypothetical protein [Demequina sp. SYSU T0a273]MDN4486983.1 hypothetical protein [Demequina sp. SYSU T00039]MDN4489667.1 hypothetical protein [Demequina sp. SYSU T00068]